MIRVFLYIRGLAFIVHKRRLDAKVSPIKKQKYSDLKLLIESSGISGPNEEFAYARYLKATEFAQYCRASGCIAKYKSLREHMGLSTIKVESDYNNPTGVAPGG